MKIVTEVKSHRGISYSVNKDGVKSVVCVTCKESVVGGQPIAIFYDENMNVLREPSVYMVRKMGSSPVNTRVLAISALKLLFAYCRIIEVPVEGFGLEEASGFVRFARGAMGESLSYSFKKLSPRSEATINAYLKEVRGYVRFANISSSPFLERAMKRRIRPGDVPRTLEGYAISAKVQEDLMAPPYVSRGEYGALRVAIEASAVSMNPAMLIVRLEFEHGLRIGEVLGLTLEDLQYEVNKTGGYDYFLVLRDRVCDCADQHVKTLPFKPRSREDYDLAAYRKRNTGYQKAYISDDLYFAIDEYIEETRARFTAEQLALAGADSVGGKWSLPNNQYVFLNSRGRRLTASLWNKRLRAYFAQAGIYVDEGRRQANLNHRLRHGYAMVLKRDLGVDDLTAMLLMRQKNPRSIRPYLLPTEEDVHQMYSTVIAGMKDLLLGGGDE